MEPGALAILFETPPALELLDVGLFGSPTDDNLDAIASRAHLTELIISSGTVDRPRAESFVDLAVRIVYRESLRKVVVPRDLARRRGGRRWLRGLRDRGSWSRSRIELGSLSDAIDFGEEGEDDSDVS